MVVDDNDNLFVAGLGCVNPTTPLEFENQGGGFQSTTDGAIYLAKFTSGRELFWSTRFGGATAPFAGPENVFSITLNSNGELHVLGGTENNNFPVLNGGGYFDDTNSSQGDYFIGKFSNNGAQLWTTLYGNSGVEFTHGEIVTDANDNIYIVGSSESDDLELFNLAGAFFEDDLNRNGSSNDDNSDAFILSFNPSMSQSWTTFFGGFQEDDFWLRGDQGLAAVTVEDDFLFIAGSTISYDNLENPNDDSVPIPVFDPMNGAYFQPNLSGIDGGQDAFIAKFCIPFLTGTNEPDIVFDNELRMFPVPTGDLLYVDVSSLTLTEEADIYIYDLLGKNVLTWSILPINGNKALDVRSL